MRLLRRHLSYHCLRHLITFYPQRSFYEFNAQSDMARSHESVIRMIQSKINDKTIPPLNIYSLQKRLEPLEHSYVVYFRYIHDGASIEMNYLSKLSIKLARLAEPDSLSASALK